MVGFRSQQSVGCGKSPPPFATATQTPCRAAFGSSRVPDVRARRIPNLRRRILLGRRSRNLQAIPLASLGGTTAGYRHHHSQRKPLAKSRSEKRPPLNVESARNLLSQWPIPATVVANRRK